MGVEDIEVLLKISDPSTNVVEALLNNRKYLNGVAATSEELIPKALESVGEVVSKGLNPELLIKHSSRFEKELVDLVTGSAVKVYLELSDPSQIGSLPEPLASRAAVGIRIAHPAPNVGRLSRLGIKFIVMPPALIRGRVVRESAARNVTLIADTVNDASTFVKLAESGVKVIVTESPTIKREARKLSKL